MDEVEALKVLHRLVSVVASAHLSVKADSKRLVSTWCRELIKLRNVSQKVYLNINIRDNCRLADYHYRGA
jgi:hypothetical protein